MNSGFFNSQQSIVLQAALAAEALLLIAGFVLGGLFGIIPNFAPSPGAFVLGCLAGLPLILGNGLFLWLCLSNRLSESTLLRLVKEAVIPLSSSLSIPAILIVSALSGIAEEYFFRGILDPLLTLYLPVSIAIALSALLFAAVHFIGNFKAYWKLIPIYTLCGIYFSLLYREMGNLIIPIAAHAINNAVVMITTRLFGEAIELKTGALPLSEPRLADQDLPRLSKPQN